jgi:uncharacterized protein (TIGR03083 family)
VQETTAATAMTPYADWMAAAEEEYRRLDVLLRSLTAEDWARPTDCTEWDVRAMVAHLAGAGASNASVRELLRQSWRARQVARTGDFVDKINEVQVRERADRSPAQLLTELAAVAPRAVRGRRRVPRPLRALPLPFGPPLGVRPLGYLLGRIYTRDAWMHRVDISRATGREPVLTADHDGRIVADVVAEWAAGHSAPYRLHLTGPAGGTWERGSGGEELRLDAVEMLRVVSGRTPGTGLLATTVPF